LICLRKHLQEFFGCFRRSNMRNVFNVRHSKTLVDIVRLSNVKVNLGSLRMPKKYLGN